MQTANIEVTNNLLIRYTPTITLSPKPILQTMINDLWTELCLYLEKHKSGRITCTPQILTTHAETDSSNDNACYSSLFEMFYILHEEHVLLDMLRISRNALAIMIAKIQSQYGFILPEANAFEMNVAHRKLSGGSLL